MARGNNLPAKKYKAGERTELKLHYRFDCGDGDSMTVKYIDLAKSLSQVNRRFYRQGLYYYVSSVTFSNGTECYVQFNTIPDTWMTKLAWKRGFQQWSKMNRLAASPDSVYPKYHDFKIMINSSATSTLDVEYGDVQGTTNYSSDDWVISKFVTMDPTMTDTGSYQQQDDDDPDVFTAHMLGPHTGTGSPAAVPWTSIGLLRSLNDVWRRDPTEGVPSLDADMDTDPIANLFDAADIFDDVRLNMDQDNDEPPYNHDSMIGASSSTETVLSRILRTGSGGAAFASGPGFCVPFGLIELTVTDFGAGTSVDDVEVIIEMVPGSYHGVHAERVI